MPEAKQHQLDLYQDLSACLCGFNTIDLEGTGMASTYLQVLKKFAGDKLTIRVLEIFESNVSRRPPEEQVIAVRQHIMSSPTYGPMARSIIKLWYLGTWYPLPASWHLEFGGSPSDHSFVVSEQAYKNALVWVPMGSHPSGARQPGFGSWQFPPKLFTIKSAS